MMPTLPGEPAVSLVPLDAIRPSARNPRSKLTAVDELAESIRAYGLLQPIVLRRVDGGYEIVAGHRRHAAARRLGLSEVPALVRDAESDEAFVLTLVENLQREDLTAREEARGLETLVRERGWTTRQVADAIKRSPAYVSKRLRVFDDAVLAPLVLANQLTVSAAEELLPLKGTKKQALAQRAAEEGWDHLRVRQAVQEQLGAKRRAPRGAGLHHQVQELRRTIRSIRPHELSEAHRRELRLLFLELATIARAPAEKRPVVLPPLPSTRTLGLADEVAS